jgi:diguanylate cyclase (GGDEF)-like protein
VGCNLRILQAGRISKYTYLEMWSTLVEGKTWRGEILNKRKQGGEYWEDVNITPVRNPAGEITNYVVVSADISERKAAEEKMHHLANYDPLTDLPNRSLMDDRLHQAIAAAKRDKANMALMFLDLDKFKPINDTLGHAVGDLLLKEASRRMLECVRESDTVGRIGGDEFVVLLPTVESDQHALLVAEKIRHALNQPFTLAGENLCISSSIGVAIYPEHGDDGKTLVKNADAAMYCAKESGRNNVRLFKAEML